MLDKLERIEHRFIEIEQSLLQADITSKKLTELTKEHANLQELVSLYRQGKDIQRDIEEAKSLFEDETEQDVRDLAREELLLLEEKKDSLEQELIILMTPQDPRDAKNVILEIRAGTGGEEAGIFVGDLLRMYMRYADEQKWKVETLSATESARGGYKEVVCMIKGKRVYSQLKFEMGVHRVQRVPTTESQGRIHTSACTVAVLAEADDLEVNIQTSDLRIDTYRSSGAGGQHVNTTDSAVRITHIPTGVVAECQDERSQHKNKDKAMKMLRSRIFEALREEQSRNISEDRKSQVGSGDRSERIRTYNFPQGRITDHRINLTLYRLDQIMNGDLQEIIDALGANFTAQQKQEDLERI